jgi:hypothetical protein
MDRAKLDGAELEWIATSWKLGQVERGMVVI